jgi:hypothetical protein
MVWIGTWHGSRCGSWYGSRRGSWCGSRYGSWYGVLVLSRLWQVHNSGCVLSHHMGFTAEVCRIETHSQNASTNIWGLYNKSGRINWRICNIPLCHKIILVSNLYQVFLLYLLELYRTQWYLTIINMGWPAIIWKSISAQWQSWRKYCTSCWHLDDKLSNPSEYCQPH